MGGAAKYNFVSRDLYVKKSHLTDLRSAKDVCLACRQSPSSSEHIAKCKAEITYLEKEIASLRESFTSLSNAKQRQKDARTNSRQNELYRALQALDSGAKATEFCKLAERIVQNSQE